MLLACHSSGALPPSPPLPPPPKMKASMLLFSLGVAITSRLCCAVHKSFPCSNAGGGVMKCQWRNTITRTFSGVFCCHLFTTGNGGKERPPHHTRIRCFQPRWRWKRVGRTMIAGDSLPKMIFICALWLIFREKSVDTSVAGEKEKT